MGVLDQVYLKHNLWSDNLFCEYTEYWPCSEQFLKLDKEQQMYDRSLYHIINLIIYYWSNRANFGTVKWGDFR